jgi:hypothetical protein
MARNAGGKVESSIQDYLAQQGYLSDAMPDPGAKSYISSDGMIIVSLTNWIALGSDNVVWSDSDIKSEQIDLSIEVRELKSPSSRLQRAYPLAKD